MSHFTVTLNEVLDRMKATSGVTRQEFGKRINMPLSTLAGLYTEGRNKPNSKTLGQIVSGCDEADGRTLILAHLEDETPDGWHGRLADEAVHRGPVTLAQIGLPEVFRQDLEYVLNESRSNPAVAGFFRELVVLMKPDRRAPKECPPNATDKPALPAPTFRVQPVPARAVATTSPPSSSTAPSGRKPGNRGK